MTGFALTSPPLIFLRVSRRNLYPLLKPLKPSKELRSQVVKVGKKTFLNWFSILEAAGDFLDSEFLCQTRESIFLYLLSFRILKYRAFVILLHLSERNVLLKISENLGFIFLRVFIFDLMGGRWSKEEGRRSFRSADSFRGRGYAEEQYSTPGYGGEGFAYHNYPTSSQSYDPPQATGYSQPYPATRQARKLDRRYSQISDNYNSLEQVCRFFFSF